MPTNQAHNQSLFPLTPPSGKYTSSRRNQRLHDSRTLRVLAVIIFGFAIANARADTRPQKPSAGEGLSTERPLFALAGDSTVTNSSGWGLGFQSLLRPNITCVNFAQSGRSSRSFQTEGFWEKCINANPRYLLIQFGHNDQPGKGPLRESAADGDFRLHLHRFIQEARHHDITPILVTPLTRRRWTGDGLIERSLEDYAKATHAVALTEKTPLIDLNKKSIEQCEKMGETAFRALEPMTEKGVDHTHLNPEGSLAVAALVVTDLISVMPEMTQYFDIKKLERSVIPREFPQFIKTNRFSLENTESCITVRSHGKTILCYNKISPDLPDKIDPIYKRSGFLHPVMTPNGKTVTAAFPFDHPHQQGIFSAWVSTTWNGHSVDFWNLAKGTGRVLHQRVHRIFAEENRVGFAVDLVHRIEKPYVVDILKERWTITVNETENGVHSFDLHSKQSLLTKKPLNIRKFHYGGFAVRGPVRWLKTPTRSSDDSLSQATGCKITNEHGHDRITGNHQQSRWVSMSGLLDGKAASITMMRDPLKPATTGAARLHPSKPYFCFAPCIEADFQITQSDPLESYFRFLITDSPPTANWITNAWENWQSEAISVKN